MGADYTAIAVIGIEINEKDIPKKHIKTKSFNHNFPESMKHSPDDGRKLWIERDLPEFTFKQEEVGDIIRVIPLPKGIKLFHGTDGKPEVLGFGIDDTYSNGGNDYCFNRIPGNLKEVLEVVLSPLGLWDESKFGLYSILYCSY